MQNPIGWVEIPATDLDRAEKFYLEVLGHKLDRQPEDEGFTMSWFPMEMGAPNAGCSLVKGDDYEPSDKGTLVYFSCDDIEKALDKVEENSGKVLMKKKDIGDYGFMGLFIDSEGNKVGLHTNK